MIFTGFLAQTHRERVPVLNVICVACIALMLLTNVYMVHTSHAGVYTVAKYVAGGVAVIGGCAMLIATAPAWVPFVTAGAGGLALVYSIMDEFDDDEDEPEDDDDDSYDYYYDLHEEATSW